jgi:hypothetical protein
MDASHGILPGVLLAAKLLPQKQYEGYLDDGCNLLFTGHGPAAAVAAAAALLLLQSLKDRTAHQKPHWVRLPAPREIPSL